MLSTIYKNSEIPHVLSLQSVLRFQLLDIKSQVFQEKIWNRWFLNMARHSQLEVDLEGSLLNVAFLIQINSLMH